MSEPTERELEFEIVYAVRLAIARRAAHASGAAEERERVRALLGEIDTYTRGDTDRPYDRFMMIRKIAREALAALDAPPRAPRPPGHADMTRYEQFEDPHTGEYLYRQRSVQDPPSAPPSAHCNTCDCPVTSAEHMVHCPDRGGSATPAPTPAPYVETCGQPGCGACRESYRKAVAEAGEKERR